MDKAYDHSHEDEIYHKWESSKAFEPNKTGKTFTIIMPPPNANDPLHVGHAMFIAIEDILIRYHRMKGDSSLWVPGTDHAGIETQFVFEKKLAKKDQSRFNFDRDTLYKMIWDYVQDNSGGAVSQMKRLGASADWSRFTFTLEPKVINFVYDTFIKLHNDKLIYREEKLVNYCVKCGTGYSELEIEYEERNDPLYYVRYPLVENNDEFVVVATVRPEPIFADTHLAVNPTDIDKKQLIGRKVLNPMTGATMEIIADEFVDPAFGTGVVKMTPAHDATDWAVAEKYNLPKNRAITMQGRLTDGAGQFAGLKVVEARKQIVQFLKEKGLIEKIDEKYTHRIATCYRDHSVIEPMPLPQFFISVKPLTKKALESLDKKEVKIYGAGREKILRNWLTNLRDWNVSRQIVWGIRIPVWYQTSKNSNIIVSFLNEQKEKVTGELHEVLNTYSLADISKGLQSLTAPKDAEFVVSKDSPGEEYIQESDTFDTWFSSGQWPVVTLKTGQAGDFEKFYPTNVMETAYEILPFWIMRMLMLGLYLTGEVPFKEVYLHGLVRDAQGRKMSKSVGNVVNPIDLVEKYGADALRMALVMGSTPGQDKSVGEQAIKGMRNFSNKIWNASRFIKDFEGVAPKNTEYNLWLNTVVKETTTHLEKLRVGQSAEQLYNEFWHGYCDNWIEKAKQGVVGKKQMEDGLLVFLKLLHPTMPFVTESCYQAVFAKRESDLLITSDWPQ